MSINFDINKAYDKTLEFYKSKKVTIHQKEDEFPYITIKDDPNGKETKYCAICFGENGKLIPLYDDICVICKARFRK